MIKSFKEVAHLYLGCEVYDSYDKDRAKVLEIKSFDWICACVDGGRMKPILRPLSSMTGEELKEVRRTMLEYSELSFNPSAHKFMSKTGQTFYYENYDDDGNYISCSISNISNLPLKCIPLLLSKHFDLFGGIESGWAIDSTKQPPTHGK